MGFLKKASYLTALIRMLPFGLIALYFGVNGLINKRTADSLSKVEGEVVFSGVRKVYSHRHYIDAFVLKVLDNRLDTISCISFYKGDIKRMDNTKIVIGSNIKVWVDQNDVSNEIQQVYYNEAIVIKYNGNIFVYLFLLIIGGLFTFSTVWYIISHPEHLFKKDEKKEESARVSNKEKKREIPVPQNHNPKPKIEKEIPFDHYEHCPACGYKLKKNDKECPDCGLNLI